MKQGLILNCLRCRGTWARKSLKRMPAHCARCNSPYWFKPRRHKRVALKVGDVVTIGNDKTQHVIRSVYVHRKKGSPSV